MTERPSGGIFVRRNASLRSRKAMAAALRVAVETRLPEIEGVTFSAELIDGVVELIIHDHVAPVGSTDVDLDDAGLGAYAETVRQRLQLSRDAAATRASNASTPGWIDYLDGFEMSGAALSRASGIGQPVISRWLQGAKPSFEGVVAIAKGLDRPVREALVAAEFLTAAEADAPVSWPRGLALRDFTSEQLLSEMLRREKARSENS